MRNWHISCHLKKEKPSFLNLNQDGKCKCPEGSNEHTGPGGGIFTPGLKRVAAPQSSAILIFQDKPANSFFKKASKE